MAKAMRKPEEFQWVLEDAKTGVEYTLIVLYYYHRGSPQTRLDPECQPEVEITGIRYTGGARSEMEWEMAREFVEELLTDPEHDECQLIMEAIHEHVADEKERRDESEREHEAMVDSAIAQSYDQDH